MFWGKCADQAELLYRYIQCNVVCCLHPPITYNWHFSPCYPSPTSPPLTVPPLLTPNRHQYVMLPSLCPCLIVQHLHMSENVVFNFMFLCQFAENDGSQIHPCPYKGPEPILFYGCIVFHGIYVPHFPCPVYHNRWVFGFIPGVCNRKQCHNEHACMCLDNR